MCRGLIFALAASYILTTMDCWAQNVVEPTTPDSTVVSTIKYRGGTYTGELSDEKPNGFGKQVWRSGNTYVGEWSHGEIHGRGELRWANGNTYTGEWRNGKRNGHGELRWASGNTYTGEWRNGKRNGHGELRWASGSTYLGEWRDGEIHGSGKLVYPDGKEWIGHFEYGKKKAGQTTSEAISPNRSHRSSGACAELAQMLAEQRATYKRQFDPKKLKKDKWNATMRGMGGHSSNSGALGGASRAAAAEEERQQRAKRKALTDLMQRQSDYQRLCGK
jgi:hypothetical protein